jgi:hypothetical protein
MSPRRRGDGVELTLLRCMTPEVARSCPPARSPLRPLFVINQKSGYGPGRAGSPGFGRKASCYRMAMGGSQSAADIESADKNCLSVEVTHVRHFHVSGSREIN